MAEVAWLTPRSHEYETECGPWRRLGGHFAHGLRLDDAEHGVLSDWPVGLYDRPFWTRSDRAPSRVQSPEPRGLSPDDLRLPPTFEAVAPPAAGEEVDRLARLLNGAGRDGARGAGKAGLRHARPQPHTLQIWCPTSARR